METLYHYCSTEAFHSILSSGTIRLSELSLSNDSLEGRWGIERMRSLLFAGGVPELQTTVILDTIGILIKARPMFGFCLSRQGDLLSQWRGYANNGSGLAIGFSRSLLEQLEVKLNSAPLHKSLLDVTYDESDSLPTHYSKRIVDLHHRGLLEEKLRVLSGLVENRANVDRWVEFDEILPRAIGRMTTWAYFSKNPAFREEEEVRLIAEIDAVSPTREPRVVLKDVSGFRASSAKLIPYIEIEFPKVSVVEIITGPQHRTPLNIVEAFSKQCGISANLRQSRASYQS